MRTLKGIVLLTLAVIGMTAVIFFIYRQMHRDYYEILTISGATPLALSERVPDTFSLTVDGLVKKRYDFKGSSMNAFATTRVRTREISAKGEFLGAYIYLGIPVFNILEGIAPQKPANAPFDQPLDILLTFTSANSKKVCFSYNEILMTDDRCPVTLAFNRKPVLPTKARIRNNYTYNRYPEAITGFRLICPKEKDTRRYLDNIVRITYSTLSVPERLLPPRKKKFKCKSDSIKCIHFAGSPSLKRNADGRPALIKNVSPIISEPVFDPVRRSETNRWTRILWQPAPKVASLNTIKVKPFRVPQIKITPLDPNVPTHLTEAISIPNVPENVHMAGIEIPEFKITVPKLEPHDVTASFKTPKAYFEMLQLRIEQFKQYPESAKDRHIEGRVKIKFAINRNGRVLSVKIVRKSRHRPLNGAAVEAIKNASPFPRPPSNLFKKTPLTFYITVTFAMT